MPHVHTNTPAHIRSHTFTASTFSTCRSPCPAWGHTLSGVIKSWRSLCPWDEIGDYSSPPCQIYRAREHSVDWICDSCHAGCLFVAHLYSHRCLDDLLIKYCSPALRMCVTAEMEFVLCQEWSFACQRLCLGISSGRKCILCPQAILPCHLLLLLYCTESTSLIISQEPWWKTALEILLKCENCYYVIIQPVLG